MNRYKLTGWCAAGPNMRPWREGKSLKQGDIEVLREYERVDGWLMAIWSYWVLDSRGNKTKLTLEEAKWAIHNGTTFDKNKGVGKLLAQAGL